MTTLPQTPQPPRWTAWAGLLAVFVVLGITLLSVVLAVGELV